jgi:NADH dehydrogenase [ubiquinone] 1 alpha subcomplex assembly factor 7
LEEIDIGYRSLSKYKDIPIVWVENIRQVPSRSDTSPFILAHEFFDALPIHAFTSVAPSKEEETQGKDSESPTYEKINTPTGPIDLPPKERKRQSAKENQWRELVVTPSPSPLSPSPEEKPEFQLSMAKASTPHSLYLPEISPRYKALKARAGATIEISPESHSYVSEFARRIGGSAGTPISRTKGEGIDLPAYAKPTPSRDNSIPARTPSGAALILDYGLASTIPSSTLRGIRSHKLVSPLSTPGLVDISADVDFVALAEAALNASQGVEVHGPVEQSFFLEALGGMERVNQLSGKKGEDERKRIREGWERLIDSSQGGMGTLYKAMAIVPSRGGKRPVGFGGDVV